MSRVLWMPVFLRRSIMSSISVLSVLTEFIFTAFWAVSLAKSPIKRGISIRRK